MVLLFYVGPDRMDIFKYFTKVGLNKFEQIALRSSDVISFFIDNSLEKYGRSKKGRDKCISDILENLACVKNSHQKTKNIKRISKILDLILLRQIS